MSCLRVPKQKKQHLESPQGTAFPKMNNRYDYSAQAAQLSAFVSTAASSAAASEDFLQQFPQDAAATITATTAKDINTFFMVCTLKN